jgi:DNA polymerase III subunit delta
VSPNDASASGSGQVAVPIHLVKGDDPVLVSDAVRQLVDEATDGADRSLMLTELDAAGYENDGGTYTIGPLVDAAQTPPFLSERRVVVGRQAAVFSTADSVAPLVAYLDDPLPSTVLVLAWEKGPRSGARVSAIPKKLADAVTRSGGQVIDTKPGTGRARTAWLDEHLDAADLRLDSGAKARLADHLGEEVSRLPILLDTLEGAFGPGARLGADDIEPYLGEAGDVAPWDLTDAIDRGDAQSALAVLDRMLAAGRHPLQITASLHGHYQRMVRLEGSGANSESQAAEVLGLKGSTFPARKALEATRTLGGPRVHEFLGLLADADLDLRGAKAWPDQLVVEVLVARLASRTPKAAARSRSGRAGARRG